MADKIKGGEEEKPKNVRGVAMDDYVRGMVNLPVNDRPVPKGFTLRAASLVFRHGPRSPINHVHGWRPAVPECGWRCDAAWHWVGNNPAIFAYEKGLQTLPGNCARGQLTSLGWSVSRALGEVLAQRYALRSGVLCVGDSDDGAAAGGGDGGDRAQRIPATSLPRVHLARATCRERTQSTMHAVLVGLRAPYVRVLLREAASESMFPAEATAGRLQAVTARLKSLQSEALRCLEVSRAAERAVAYGLAGGAMGLGRAVNGVNLRDLYNLIECHRLHRHGLGAALDVGGSAAEAVRAEAGAEFGALLSTGEMVSLTIGRFLTEIAIDADRCVSKIVADEDAAKAKGRAQRGGRASDGAQLERVRLLLYAGHDNTVHPLSAALAIGPAMAGTPPDPCDVVGFEVATRDADGERFVRAVGPRGVERLPWCPADVEEDETLCLWDHFVTRVSAVSRDFTIAVQSEDPRPPLPPHGVASDDDAEWAERARQDAVRIREGVDRANAAFTPEPRSPAAASSP